VHKADNLPTFHVLIILEILGASTSWRPKGLSWHVMG